MSVVRYKYKNKTGKTKKVFRFIAPMRRGSLKKNEVRTIDRPDPVSCQAGRQAAVAFSSLRMIEKMKSADSRHSTISTLQTIHRAMPLPQR